MSHVLVRQLERRGDSRFHANVKLEVQAQTGFELCEFRVDTGAELSVIGLEQAERAGLPVPDEAVQLSMQMNAIETQVRLGTIRVRFVIDARTVGPHRDALWTACAPFPQAQVVCEFEWDCMFVVGRPDTAPWLLGLGGYALSEVDWRFRGAHRGFPVGSVEFELYPQPDPTVPVPPAG